MSGGGTAGHVFPMIAVAERLRDLGHDVRFAGSATGQEASVVPAAGFVFVPVSVTSAQSRLSPRTVSALWRTYAASRALRPLVQACDVVVGIGGYASAPAVVAARRSRIPIVLIEQNGVPGAVNRIAARWASVVATTFEATAERLPPRTRVVRTGNPVRRAIVAVAHARTQLRSEALRAFDLEGDRLTVVVLGGSQGARQLDRIVAAAIDDLRHRADVQLLVVTGPANLQEVEPAARASGELLVRAVGFVDRMDRALAVADLALSRAGAGAIAELAVCGVPAILVPYPHATEHHQEANAREMERAGAAEVLPERSLTPGGLAERLTSLLDDPDRRDVMASSMLTWARPDADARIAGLVEEVA
jgi:UDP-N-acetylglucosamine--N-acetylmuramyl-(pentapeptide) pyrophosphoryl-undecaprenol N-acetylglucosamine transferase